MGSMQSTRFELVLVVLVALCGAITLAAGVGGHEIDPADTLFGAVLLCIGAARVMQLMRSPAGSRATQGPGASRRR
jgi:hypothetical protein